MSDEPIQHDDARPTCQCIHGRILRGETTIDYSLFRPDLACMRCDSTGYLTAAALAEAKRYREAARIVGGGSE